MTDCEERQTFDERMEYIEDEAQGPRRVLEDGVDVSARSAEDIIRLSNYAASSRRLGAYGLRACVRQQIRPPDATGANSQG